MIYNSQHNKLFPTPVVVEPEYDILKGSLRYQNDLAAYNHWLSSGIEVIGEHNWKDGQEVEEGKDYRIAKPRYASNLKYEVKTFPDRVAVPIK